MPHIRKNHTRTTAKGTKSLVGEHLVRDRTKKPQDVANLERPSFQDNGITIIKSRGASLAEKSLAVRTNLALKLPYQITVRNDTYPLLPDHVEFAKAMSARLRVHHATHSGSLDKNKFEDAFESIYQGMGIHVEKTVPNHPGADVQIYDDSNALRFSLKTEGGANISEDSLFITKFREFSKNLNTPSGISDVKKAFLNHLDDYDRIVVLRSLLPQNKKQKKYEIVEIPKAVLQRVKGADFEVSEKSGSQHSPLFANVYNKRSSHLPKDQRLVDFQLYYTGGDGTRKIQIKRLKKELCIVHAEFSFEILTDSP